MACFEGVGIIYCEVLKLNKMVRGSVRNSAKKTPSGLVAKGVMLLRRLKVSKISIV
jgi:hypothetical protein